MSTIPNIDNPVQYQHDKMLLAWLAKQTCTKDEMYRKIYKTMKEMGMNAAAEEFHKKAFGDIN